MAKEENLEVEGEPKKGKGKLFIIIGAVVALLAIGGGAAFFLMGGDSEQEVTEDAEPQVVQSLYFKYSKPFLVSFQQGNVQRYLQIDLTFKTKDQKVIDLLQQHEPVVKSRLNTAIGSQEIAVLQTDEGRQAMVQELTQLVQDFISQHDETATVESVLFTNFVMQ